MTTIQLRKSLKKAGKPVCLSHLYRLFRILDIAPAGRSRPQQYPADTAARILVHLGFSAVAGVRKSSNGVHPPRRDARPAHLISTAALRAAKPKTKGTK